MLFRSTIVSLAGAHARAPRILRQGILSPADLERAAGVDLSERTADTTVDTTVNTAADRAEVGV